MVQVVENVDIDLCIDIACELYFTWGPLAGLTQEQRVVIKAMLAWGNIHLMAREYADDGDEDAQACLGEITATRRRV